MTVTQKPTKIALSILMAAILAFGLFPLFPKTAYAVGEVCEIVETGTQYMTFDAALADVVSGQTIKLLDDANHTDNIGLSAGFELTLELNGFTLTHDYIAGLVPPLYALVLTDDSSLTVVGPGTYNVNGLNCGGIAIIESQLFATEGAAINVTGATSGIYSEKAAAEVSTIYAGLAAITAIGKSALNLPNVVVLGDVVSDANDRPGIEISDNATVLVGGDVYQQTLPAPGGYTAVDVYGGNFGLDGSIYSGSNGISVVKYESWEYFAPDWMCTGSRPSYALVEGNIEAVGFGAFVDSDLAINDNGSGETFDPYINHLSITTLIVYGDILSGGDGLVVNKISQATVNGNIQVNAAFPATTIGVYASASTVEVYGSIYSNANGALADNGAYLLIGGDACMTGGGGLLGVSAHGAGSSVRLLGNIESLDVGVGFQNGGQVFVGGNVYAEDTGVWGVMGGQALIEGSLYVPSTGYAYIGFQDSSLGTHPFDIGDFFVPSSIDGYYEYQFIDGTIENFVWVGNNTDYVCQIVTTTTPGSETILGWGPHYTSLELAVEAVPMTTWRSILLLEDIAVTEGLVLLEQFVYILNDGHDLIISNAGGVALSLTNSFFYNAGDGAFVVLGLGTDNAIEGISRSYSDVALVLEADGVTGIHVTDKDHHFYSTEGITGAGKNVLGGYVGPSAHLTLYGDIDLTGEGSMGAYVERDSRFSAPNITTAGVGIVNNGGEVYVDGDVVSGGEFGVICSDGGYVRIEGTLVNGNGFIRIGDPLGVLGVDYQIFGADDFTDFVGGYYVYEFPGHGMVLVADAAVSEAPTITGPALHSYDWGYAAFSASYTLTGNPKPTVALSGNDGDGKISWNATDSKLEVAAGLPVGDYLFTLTASNGVSPNATIDVKLEVKTLPATAYTTTKHFGVFSGSGTLEGISAGPFGKFDYLDCEGVLVDPSNYTVADGSTVITLSEAYLLTFANGDYNFTAVFDDGYSVLTLTVDLQDTSTGSQIPNASDNTPLTTWMVTLLVSSCCLLVTLAWRKRALA